MLWHATDGALWPRRNSNAGEGRNSKANPGSKANPESKADRQSGAEQKLIVSTTRSLKKISHKFK